MRPRRAHSWPRVIEVMEPVRVELQARYFGLVHEEQIRLLKPARIYALQALVTRYRADPTAWHEGFDLVGGDAPVDTYTALHHLRPEGFVELKGGPFFAEWRLTTSGLDHWEQRIAPQLEAQAT